MCGIVGFIDPKRQARYDLGQVASQMADRIRHRGPDAEGVWVSESEGAGFGHRRLSILDLSEAANQPFVSQSGRYVLIYNGEVYNHMEIRARMPDVSWKTTSDTETLVEALERLGFEKTLKLANGMYAFALWDKAAGKLSLARDRVGKKPLYYGSVKGVFYFTSELKALKAHPSWDGRVDRAVLDDYLRFGYVPAPHSIYEGIGKLPAGHYMHISLDDVQSGSLPKSAPYWSLEDVIQKREEMDGPDVLDGLHTLLLDAVKLRMHADVPLGCFLSGGYDSSLVTALMQAQSSHAVKTFSIGFDEAGYNEAHHAKAVAEHLKTDHTELYVTPKEAMDVIPQLPDIYCEPFADSSQVPTYLVSQLARQKVTVSLSGDGGDELFCGYNRYFLLESVYRKLKLCPAFLQMSVRQVMRFLSAVIPSGFWDNSLTERIVPRGRAEQYMYKFIELLPVRSRDELYLKLLSQWKRPEMLTLHDSKGTSWASQIVSDTYEEVMMARDFQHYLPDDILVKVDRASMAHSLEARCPLLDYRVAEYAWNMPFDYKLRGGQGKWALRQVLYNYVPASIMERPKMGFGVPIHEWLRGPLCDWASALLDPVRVRREGYFDAHILEKRWNEHVSGRYDWGYSLWCVLMFQAWLDKE